MPHTFNFSHSHAHRAYLLTRQDVCIVGYCDGFVAVARKCWNALLRSIARSKQRRLENELKLRGVKYREAGEPRLPVWMPDKWEN